MVDTHVREGIEQGGKGRGGTLPFPPAPLFQLVDIQGAGRGEKAASAVRAFGRAVELDCLTEELHAALLHRLREGAGTGALAIDARLYAGAYRRCANRPARERQIALVRESGEALGALAQRPLIARAVGMMRGPAHVAGLGQLHEFLEREFRAFRHVRGCAARVASPCGLSPRD